MRDTLLFGLLAGGNLDHPDLEELLREAGRLGPRQRLPFWGVLEPALEHPNAAVRAAAVKVLAGARGTDAFRWIVRALDDREDAVVESAAYSLMRSSSEEPGRLCHALFHPRPVARLAVLSVEQRQATKAMSSLAAHALADPESADLAERRLNQWGPLSPASVRLLLEGVEAGELDREVAGRLIVEVLESVRLADFLAPLRGRATAAPSGEDTPAGIERSVEAARAQEDDLDRIVGLFCPPGPDGAGAMDSPLTRRFFAALREDLESRRAVRFAPWSVALSVASVLLGKPRWPTDALALSSVILPGLLAHPGIPVGDRKAAAATLAGVDLRRPERWQDLPAVIGCGIADREDGCLDLPVAAGISRLLSGSCLVRLLRTWGKQRVVESLHAGPTGLDALCSLPQRGPGEAAFSEIIRALLEEPRTTTAAHVTVLAAALPLDRLEELAVLRLRPAGERMGLVKALLAHASTEGRFSERRAAALSEAVGSWLEGEGFALREVLPVVLGAPGREHSSLAPALLGWLGRRYRKPSWLSALKRLSKEEIVALASMEPVAPGFPFPVAHALMSELLGHPDPVVADWAKLAVPRKETSPRPARGQPPHELKQGEHDRIAACPEHDLGFVVEMLPERPSRGLTAALDARSGAPVGDVRICKALILADDPPDEVDRLFSRYEIDGESFDATLERCVVEAAAGLPQPSLFANALLHRWSANLSLFALAADSWEGGILGMLKWALGLESDRLCAIVWRGCSATVRHRRWREHRDLAELAPAGTIELLFDVLTLGDLDEGRSELAELLPPSRGLNMEQRCEALRVHASEMLVDFHRGRVEVEAIDARRNNVLRLIGEMSMDVRVALSRWVSSHGLGKASVTKVVTGTSDLSLLEEARTSRSAKRLEKLCRSAFADVATAAARSLLALGEPGAASVAAALESVPALPCVREIALTIPDWPDGAALDRCRALAAHTSGLPEVRFCVALALMARGDSGALEHALRAAVAPSETSWFLAEDWRRLKDLGASAERLACALAVSPHHSAWGRAVAWLVDRVSWRPDIVLDALAAFLHTGTERLEELRVEAAAALLSKGRAEGLPVLLPYAGLGRSPVGWDSLWEGIVRLAEPEALRRVTAAVLAAGRDEITCELVDALVGSPEEADVRTELLAAIAGTTPSESAQGAALSALRRAPRAPHPRLRELARVWLEAERNARLLTGAQMEIEMLAGGELGYARMGSRCIQVNPLPLLRVEPNGETVVRALVLHELGHHVYHGGPRSAEVWAKALDEGLGDLLNLVADEHLERNMRARDEEHGNALKVLAAYAFRHSRREVDARSLTASLGWRCFEVLTATALEVGRAPDSVRLRSGSVLRSLEGSENSFARFVTALRMGLGNRHGDERVAQALTLFGRSFRGSSMEQLLGVARELKAIFGDETALLAPLGPGAIERVEVTELNAASEGMTQEDLQEAADELLRPAGGVAVVSRSEQDGPDSSLVVRGINLGEDTDFAELVERVVVPFDPRLYAEHERVVAPLARRMRRFFVRMGIGYTREGGRVQGRSVDRGRIRAALLRSDPRMLCASERVLRNDLHIGTLVDCSGSMAINENHERAKLFATLLSAATRGLPGIDTRFYGFDDQTLFEAGGGRRCAAASLEVGGGNNDAGALFAAAKRAMSSKRSRRLLIMVSDGSPTECTVEALRNLVAQLTRRHGFLCVQVALRRLDHVTFPHHVEILDDDMSSAVSAFGRCVVRLVGASLGR